MVLIFILNDVTLKTSNVSSAPHVRIGNLFFICLQEVAVARVEKAGDAAGIE